MTVTYEEMKAQFKRILIKKGFTEDTIACGETPESIAITD